MVQVLPRRASSTVTRTLSRWVAAHDVSRPPDTVQTVARSESTISWVTFRNAGEATISQQTIDKNVFQLCAERFHKLEKI